VNRQPRVCCIIQRAVGIEGIVERSAHLQGVTPLRFAVDHFHDILVQLLSGRVSLCPVVSRTTAILRHEDILRVIEIREWRRQYIVNDLPGVQAFRVYITMRRR
jgi:hypothetical protein